MCPPTFPEGIPCYLYYVVMGVAVIGWLVLIFFPRRPWANFWFAGLAVPLILSFFYMYLLITFWWGPPPARLTEFLTLEGVHVQLTNRGLLLVAWINIIAMDLVVGAWMARKAAQVRMPYVYLLPCLIMTYVFAGFGFTLFTIVMSVGGKWPLVARVEDVPPLDSFPVSARAEAASSIR
jgi:hypothetical protein